MNGNRWTLLLAIGLAGFCQAAEVGQSEVQTVKLVLCARGLPAEVNGLSLLPKAQALTGADAYPLYQAAMKALPENLNRLDQIPLNLFSVEDAKPTVEELAPVLAELHKAARCKTCTWPEVKQGALPDGVDQFRQLAYVVASQAHYHLAKAEYGEAARVISTGLAMARHLGQAHNLMLQMVGIAVGSLMFHEVEQWIQCPDAPILFEAIKGLPRPFIDPHEQIQREIQAARSDPRFILARKAMEDLLRPAHDRIRQNCRGVDRRITALQAVEALRLYAAKQGNLPKTLVDTGLPIPNDPLTQKPFSYTTEKTDSMALLEGKPPEGAGDRDGLRYELTLVKGP
jgi:hypothetical protein